MCKLFKLFSFGVKEPSVAQNDEDKYFLEAYENPLKYLTNSSGKSWADTKSIGGGTPHYSGETCDLFDDLDVKIGRTVFAHVHRFSICPERNVAVIKHFALSSKDYAKKGLSYKIIKALGEELKANHDVDKIQFHISPDKPEFKIFFRNKLRAKSIDPNGFIWEWRIP